MSSDTPFLEGKVVGESLDMRRAGEAPLRLGLCLLHLLLFIDAYDSVSRQRDVTGGHSARGLPGARHWTEGCHRAARQGGPSKCALLALRGGSSGADEGITCGGCGRSLPRKVVMKESPNKGRGFYSCSGQVPACRRSFQWESDVKRASPYYASAVSASFPPGLGAAGMGSSPGPAENVTVFRRSPQPDGTTLLRDTDGTPLGVSPHGRQVEVPPARHGDEAQSVSRAPFRSSSLSSAAPASPSTHSPPPPRVAASLANQEGGMEDGGEERIWDTWAAGQDRGPGVAARRRGGEATWFTGTSLLCNQFEPIAVPEPPVRFFPSPGASDRKGEDGDSEAQALEAQTQLRKARQAAQALAVHQASSAPEPGAFQRALGGGGWPRRAQSAHGRTPASLDTQAAGASGFSFPGRHAQLGPGLHAALSMQKKGRSPFKAPRPWAPPVERAPADAPASPGLPESPSKTLGMRKPPGPGSPFTDGRRTTKQGPIDLAHGSRGEERGTNFHLTAAGPAECTVKLRGAHWSFASCEVKCAGGVALLCNQEGEVFLGDCEVGGLGRQGQRATDGVIAMDGAAASLERCAVRDTFQGVVAHVRRSEVSVRACTLQHNLLAIVLTDGASLAVSDCLVIDNTAAAISVPTDPHSGCEVEIVDSHIAGVMWLGDKTLLTRLVECGNTVVPPVAANLSSTLESLLPRPEADTESIGQDTGEVDAASLPAAGVTAGARKRRGEEMQAGSEEARVVSKGRIRGPRLRAATEDGASSGPDEDASPPGARCVRRKLLPDSGSGCPTERPRPFSARSSSPITSLTPPPASGSLAL